MPFWTSLKEWLFGVDLISVDDVKAIVDSLDTDKSGYISVRELTEGVKKWTRM